MYEYIKQIPLDTSKRHFVVGDIHGHFNAFLRLLDSVNYDPLNDVIYSVGDIIDRGDKSYETVQFFSEPDTHCIMGNHEYMVTDDKWTDCWLRNGGVNTLYSLDDNDSNVEWLKEWCMKLPFVLDVGEFHEEDAFRLVHAELPLEWDEQRLWLQLEYAAENGGDSGVENLIWSRTAIGEALFNTEGMRPADWEVPIAEGRSGRNVFCGHTPTKHVVRLHDLTFLDTKKSETLTMVNAITKAAHTVKLDYKDFKNKNC